MKRAIFLAKRGAGWVNPNPLVGAVLVKDDHIIGEGYHEYFGGPHAEVNAINAATGPVEGATLYVTMEPCNHQGKTPPCTSLILEKGISKVVVGMHDPNPLVKGGGTTFLSQHGIIVETGIMEREIAVMNEVFVKFIATGLPFCILKSAMTLDGKIATITNTSRWITGERSRRCVHRLRQQLSAVMVGVNTVLFDDPMLNIRLRGKNYKNPLKIIVDTHGRIPLESKVLLHDPQLTIVASTELTPTSKRKEIERKGAQVLTCPLKNGKVDLEYLMKSLGTMGIDSILIEGGSTLAFSALREKIVDKVITFIAPKLVGGDLAPTSVGGEGIAKMEEAIEVRDWKVRKMGEDILVEGYLKKNKFEYRTVNIG